MSANAARMKRSPAVMPSPSERIMSGAKPITLKRNFGWALSGNVIYEGSQWLNLIVLAKLLSAADVGRFALALAICTPISTFAALKLRSVQVTDSGEQYRLGHFLGLQLVTAAAGCVAIALIALLGVGDGRAIPIILIVGFGQAVVLVRDVFLAYNQKQERMDTVASSKALCGIASIIAMGVAVWLTRSLLVGVVCLQLAKLLTLIGYDLRTTARVASESGDAGQGALLKPIWHAATMRSLFWLALPLGIASVTFSLYTNVPRYFIESWFGAEQLGFFAAIMALVMAGKQVTEAAGQAALPRLSRLYLIDRRGFVRLVAGLVAGGLVLGMLGIAAVLVAGPFLLEVLFTAEYAQYQTLFAWSMVIALVDFIANPLGYAMTAMRRFRVQPVAYAVGLLIVVPCCAWLIPQHGLVGAAWAMILGTSTIAAISLAVIIVGLRQSTPARAVNIR